MREGVKGLMREHLLLRLLVEGGPEPHLWPHFATCAAAFERCARWQTIANKGCLLYIRVPPLVSSFMHASIERSPPSLGPLLQPHRYTGLQLLESLRSLLAYGCRNPVRQGDRSLAPRDRAHTCR